MLNKINKILLKKNKTKIICLTAYTKNLALVLDNHCDIVLVGDSLASVLYGMKTTRDVTIDMMINHTKSVRQGVKKSLLVVDMPYKTYQNKNQALVNAKKIIKYTKCDAVKLEGGENIINIVKHLINNKIPVMGHLGLLPQTQKGKFRYKGRSSIERKKILKDSQLLAEAGVFSIVLECVETSLAKLITQSISIPTIGIGASKYCDGQVLVTDDLLGLNKINFRFVKKYINLNKIIDKTILKFKKDVIRNRFPHKRNSY